MPPSQPSLADASQDKRKSFMTWPVFAWGLWDWGSAAFNAVITTFVFTVYLSSSSFGDTAKNESAISLGLTIAGFLIAALAPVTGQRSDRAGKNVYWLGIYSLVVTAVAGSLFFIKPDPAYLWPGIILLGIGNVFFELASVNYNGLLSRLTPKDRMGAVSGFGWGMGYLGGIVLLGLLFVGFINTDTTWFGTSTENGMGVRQGMLVAAAWFGLSAIPVLWTQSVRRADARARRDGLDVPDRSEALAQPRESLLASYKRLWRTLVALFKTHPEVVWFLAAAAIYRDGLAGVFTYGGIIAQNTFGFTPGEVIIFAIVANVVAGVVTIGAGHLDDLFGPKRVIVGSLVILVICGILTFILHSGGKPVFWILGLLLSACVGPAQSASRSLLARLIPYGREGEIFGLYATTGRAVSFVAPAMYGLSVWIGKHVSGADAGYWGILGVVLVLAVGLAMVGKIQDPKGHITDLGDES
ncbi:MFS transporter [Actinomyces vulturis]|uniref:MFS transporter n=1 Tax=Actinomyces vulturis TaxID=1857645 RepID=UPI00082AF44B|nr:MFS transporter [Actinomyces vulturis]